MVPLQYSPSPSPSPPSPPTAASKDRENMEASMELLDSGSRPPGSLTLPAHQNGPLGTHMPCVHHCPPIYIPTSLFLAH